LERGEEDGEGEEEVDLSLLADRPEYQFADPTSNKPMGSERAYLKRREGELSIDEKKGEVNVITDPEGANTGSGLKKKLRISFELILFLLFLRVVL